MSSSDIRCSGERSVAEFDLTIDSQKKKSVENGEEEHTEERQQVPAFIWFSILLTLLDSQFLFLDKLPRYLVDRLLTLPHSMGRLVRLLLDQRRMTGPENKSLRRNVDISESMN
jgi:hypothetical protein